MGRRVLIATRTFGSTSQEPWDILAAAGCEPVRMDIGAADDDAFATAFLDVEGAIVGARPITAPMIAASRQLKVISMHGVGVDHIDAEAARARGVVIANAPGANAASVADLAMGLLLAVSRDIPRMDSEVRQGGWSSSTGTELWQKTLGIVGLGQVGLGVASRARGFDMTVLATDPFIPASTFADHRVRSVGLDELFASADAISLHAPASPGTFHLVDRDRLAQMKPTAFLINTARGHLVDETALYEALRTGGIAGAGLDAFAHEPPVGSPLLALPNVVVSPHIGAHTREAVTRASVMAARNVVEILHHGRALARPSSDA